MAREKRIQSVGFHYITSRSVEYKTIFIQNNDYSVFISILSALSKKYNFKIHSYSILISSYHLLIQTTQENLSIIIKFLNSQYSKYFNKKYKRTGTLWNTRFKSFFISNENYISYFLRYVEHIPKLVGVTTNLNLYYYSSYRQFIGLDKRLFCIKDSVIFTNFNTVAEIEEFFSTPITKDDIEHICYIIKKERKKNRVDISSFLLENQTRAEENIGIIESYKSGFSQKEIADRLNISQQAVQKRIKKINREKDEL